MSLSVVFMGTPAFAVPALQGLLHSQHKVIGVYTQPPRPAGRGQKLTSSPVHILAEAHNIPVFTPVNFKSPEPIAALKALKADIAVVVAYGLLLPKAVLEAFPKGCINIHPSLLPRWRGAAPIHRTVLAGDPETAIAIMQMDEGLDTGDVLSIEHIALATHITSGALHDMLSERAVPLLLQTLDAIEQGKATRTQQSEAGVEYAKKISKDEAKIDWNESAEAIERKVRGLNPYPIAVSTLNNQPIKIWAAEVINYSGAAGIGTVIDEAFTIACGKNALRPTFVQQPGKKPIAVSEWLRGHPVPVGTKLG